MLAIFQQSADESMTNRPNLLPWLMFFMVVQSTGCGVPKSNLLTTAAQGQKMVVQFADESFRPKIDDKVNRSKIKITPQPANCQGTSDVIVKEQTGDNLSLTVEVLAQCAYQFEVFLSRVDDKKVETALYRSAPTEIAQEKLSTEVSRNGLMVAIKFQSDTGAALPPIGSSGADATVNNGTGTPPPGTSTNNGTVTGGGKQLALSDLFKNAMIDKNGQVTSWAEKIKTQYILVDLSSSSCGNCQALAQELSSEAFKPFFAKCGLFTFVGRSEVSAWLKTHSGSVVGDNSYTTTSGNVLEVVRMLGKTPKSSSIPIVMFVDVTTGAILSESQGYNSNLPPIQMLKEKCQ